MCESVCVALIIQHAKRMRRAISSPVTRTIPHYLLQDTNFRNKVTANNMGVSSFSTNLPVTFLILRRPERDIITVYVGLHVRFRCYCHILMKPEISRQIFEKD